MHKKPFRKTRAAAWVGLFFVSFALTSCGDQTKPLMDAVQGMIDIKTNPFNVVPLGALFTFTTKEECEVSIEVQGKIPVKKSFAGFSRSHSIPVLGLYADTMNTVTVTLTTKSGQQYQGNLFVNTDPLPAVFPEMNVVTLQRDKMEPGLHLVEVLIANNGEFDAYPMMFDDNGDVRWYINMSAVKPFPFTTYRMQNGNWLFISWVELYELSDLGQLIRHDRLTNYSADHDVIELANGELLMGASKKDSRIVREGKAVESRYDYVIQVNKDRKVIKEWDLRQVLDVDRSVFRKDFSLDFSADWFHLNSVAWSSTDNGLLVSGRNQGVVKVDQNNQLQWILAPHKAWGKAGFDGAGLETTDYLLQALDRNGQPLPAAVQEGTEASDDFEWPTGQHALRVLDNGNLLLFDNGLARNFSQSFSYSRAVEYRIDPAKKTIQQVWEYGKSRGLDLFSAITSDVDVLPATGNRLLTAGNIRLGSLPAHGALVEVTYPDNEVVFEANVFLKDALGTGAQEWAQFDVVYRGERYPLYK